MNRAIAMSALILTLSLGFIASCKDKEPDAVTQASPHKSSKKVTLPPKGADYEVVGVKEGLSGYMIKYDDKIYRGGRRPRRVLISSRRSILRPLSRLRRTKMNASTSSPRA